MMKKNRILMGLAATAATALALTGCASNGGGSESSAGGASGDKDITIAVFNGWDEGIAASELWKSVLEDEGYDVTLEYAEPAVVYAGVAAGDYDLVLDTWLPLTHAEYIDKFGADMVDLGSWYDNAKLTIAVNEDAPIDSLEDLAKDPSVVGNKLIGIEAGAGLTKITQEKVIPGYGLDKMDYVISSTPAMLAELKSATDKGENIAVTLWRPHWAYSSFPVKDLEDPKGLLGDAEQVHSYASKDFAEEHKDIADRIGEFTMDDETLASLENAMFNEYDGDDYGPVVKDWMADNADFAGTLTAKK